MGHLAGNLLEAEIVPEDFTVVSTFSGCGGSSLGYELAGGRVLLACEWDDNAVETYRLNFPGTPVHHGDVAELSVGGCCELAGVGPGELDIFDGSPPCQGFSTSGKRNLDDPRNQLFREYVRLLRGLRPRAFIMENVYGMVKGKMRLVFAECLRELKACGYLVRARVLNAKYFGVPQSRQRLIFIGVRDDLGIEPSHPKARSRPGSAGSALRGVKNDPAEVEMLLEAGRKHGAYRLWHRLRPGRSAQDILTTQGWSCVKVHPGRPAPTVCKNDSCISLHGLMHWAERRRFTLPEYRRLSTFPDGFQFAGGWSDGVARIGNSVPPNFMRAIAEHVRDEILAPADGAAGG